MRILALELSSSRGSIALGGDEVMEESWPNDRKNSGVFFRKLAIVRERYGPADLIVAGLGPGSYAGIRIAVATAMGLATAWQARLLGAPSICALEGELSDFFVVGDARRQSFFFAEVKNRTLAGEPELLSEDALRTQILARQTLPTFSTEVLPQFPNVAQRFPSAGELARLAAMGSLSLSSPPLRPLYLREPSITLPKNRSLGQR
jgi:tRNA threonylcarbamoyladenosine biosynthesis protein TsaB